MKDTRATPRMVTSWGRFRYRGALLILLGMMVGVVLATSWSPTVQAALQVGGNGNDVLFGRDNDNAANPFIQPPGVTAKQHLDNTDIMLGRNGGDLLIGLLGDDVQHGEDGDDILIGGTENFQAPNSDVPVPTSNGMSFQNFEENNGTPPDSYCFDAWYVQCTLTTTRVYEGKRAIQADAHAGLTGEGEDTGGTVGINPASSGPIDLSSATTISVWVYDTCGNNDIELMLRDINDAESNPVWSEASKSVQNQWTQIIWPLSFFKDVDKSQIKNIELYEYHDCIYYFDAVEWH